MEKNIYETEQNLNKVQAVWAAPVWNTVPHRKRRREARLPVNICVCVSQDVSKINEGKPPLYQDDTNKRILNSLELLKGLDEDAVNATRLQHPQAEMIEQE